ncbi:hypothetical protein M2227_007682 [Bradyrhizobium elkanii]|uniref:hypothetical protein n=1 Tax=Bradyrhizobium elkanii TaxID=29448 RepID=UPI002226FA31|nr:hypothetical protein [Bradyrhizobium elkanii]MCW2205592.1 hypothetical protein [Bradyrhizobium elkanii]
MSRCCSRTEAFKVYNMAPKNPRYSLSAMSDDASMVAMSFWQDEFKMEAGRMIYERSRWGDWSNGPGRRECIKHLAWSMSRLGGKINVVISTRKWTENGYVRTDSFARPGVIMRVVHLDPVTGAFRLEQVLPEKHAA